MKIEIADLTFAYDGKKVLKGINLTIKEGEFLGLMGPNGSGKTTLLRCMMNYLRPEHGAILLDAKPIHALKDAEIARLFAVVPQSSPTDFSFTAYEMVMMGRIPHSTNRLSGESRADADAVRSAMRRTNTWSFVNRSFATLSGGERQRVIIARALAQNPKTLLLDEPTVFLDIAGQFEIMDLLRTLNEDGLTIVAVLHDLNLAARYCDRIALLHNGRLEAYGTAEEVFNPENIARIYGIEVIVRRDPLTHAVSTIPRISSIVAPMHGTRVHVLCGGATGGPVIKDLLDAGYSPSTGVLNVLDSDFATAQDLHIPIISEIPFAQVSEDAHTQNLKQIEEAEIVIVTDFPIGPGNLKNIEAAEYALEIGKTVIIINPQTIDERDFVVGRAKALLEKLLKSGAKDVKERAALLTLLTERLKK